MNFQAKCQKNENKYLDPIFKKEYMKELVKLIILHRQER